MRLCLGPVKMTDPRRADVIQCTTLQRVEPWLCLILEPLLGFHVLAASVLLVFALSRFAGFAVGGAQYAPPNLVIPYLTDEQVFFVAGLLELWAAWLCWRWRGNPKASVMILFFVSLMVWYRLAQVWLGSGTSRCGCFGLLGTFTGMSVRTEKLLSAVVLVVLVLCALPAHFEDEKRDLKREQK